MWLHAVRRCRDPSRRACVMFLFCTPDGVAENSRWLSDSATTGNWPHPKTHSNPQGCVWFPVAPRCFGTERTSCTRFQWRIPGFRLQVCPAATIGECFTPVWCVFLNHEWARIDTNIGVSVWTGRLAPFRFYGASMSSARRCTVGAGPLFLRRRNAGVFDQCVGSIGTKVVRFRSKAFSAASRARR